MQKVIWLLSLCIIGTYGQVCPFYSCGENMYEDGLEYNTCLERAEAAGTCIQEGLKSTACDTCDKWDFNYYASERYVDDKRSYCTYKECDLRGFGECFEKDAIKLLYFLDTSNIDNVISCIDGWNPSIGRQTCFNSVTQMDVPESFDIVNAIKQALEDVKEGCDPFLPILECRSNLKALAPRMMGPYGRNPDTAAIQTALENMGECVSSAIKKYSCPRIEKLLPTLKEVVPSGVAQMMSRYGPYNENAKDEFCQGAGNPKFARFFFRN